MEVARQREAAVRTEVDSALSALLGSDWAETPFVLVAGHRRENVGEGMREIRDAVRTLGAPAPRLPIRVPGAPEPERRAHRQAPPGRAVDSSPDPSPGIPRLCGVDGGLSLLLQDSGGRREEAPSLGKAVLVVRDTTERTKGVAAGTARLVGPRGQSIVGFTNQLLEDREPHLAMANAVNQ
jgi:UDP-N-acetylglucosamine 2-epimerase (non-hydrolysing)